MWIYYIKIGFILKVYFFLSKGGFHSFIPKCCIVKNKNNKVFSFYFTTDLVTILRSNLWFDDVVELFSTQLNTVLFKKRFYTILHDIH